MSGTKKRSGVYIRTEKHSKILSEAQMGHSFRGNLHHSDETKKKISNAIKGILHPFFGKHHTLGSNIKNRNSHLGKKLTEQQKIKIGNSCRGEKHWNWTGGNKKYTTDWTETLRRSIRERDTYICQLCEMPQGDISFDVHHIDYDKKNCNPSNLITLCHNCHSKTNKDRNYWTNYFIALVLIK